ncbi:SIS domain-containing protein [bacterium]|nr:SIS domain-containing protein [bacterium]
MDLSNGNILRTCLAEMTKSSRQLDLTAINQAIDLLFETYQAGKKVLLVGNGGSASTAAHFAADLGKFATGNKPGFRAMDLVGNYSAHTAWTNDTSWENTWVGMLSPWIEEGDVLVLFSVHGGSGWSNNLVRAIELASQRGAKTIGFSGANGGKFDELCNVSIVVPSPSPEFITPVTESIHVMIQHMICAALRVKLNGELQ